MLNFGLGPIIRPIFFLDQVMNFGKFIDSILVVRLNNKHTTLNKVLPVLARTLLKWVCELKYVDGLIELIVINVQFDEDLEGFLDKDMGIFSLELDTVFEVKDTLLFAVGFEVAESEVVVGLRGELLVGEFLEGWDGLGPFL